MSVLLLTINFVVTVVCGFAKLLPQGSTATDNVMTNFMINKKDRYMYMKNWHQFVKLPTVNDSESSNMAILVHPQ